MKIKIEGLPEPVEGVQEINVQDGATQNIIQTSELADSLKELNDDTLDLTTRQSGIDLRTRLHPFEINSILAIDTLVSLGVLPIKCLSYTRQKKRLAVSLLGKGRDDIVKVVSGKRELEQSMSPGGGMGDKIAGWFGQKKE